MATAHVAWIRTYFSTSTALNTLRGLKWLSRDLSALHSSSNMLGRAKFFSFVALVSMGCMLLQPVDAWLPHVITKGKKFFYSDTGVEFRMKGMAYYPRPNAGEFADVSNYDWAADEHENVWGPHLDAMKSLNVNTVRLYSVDPSKSHDKFMCACSEAGIYVLVGLAAPCEECAVVDAEPPACYPEHLLTRAQMIYNAFAVYDNTLGFSVGNENNLQVTYGADGTTTAPCVKAFLRDVRNYASSCLGALRAVPIGLDIADTLPRSQWIEYYDCPVDDNEFTRAEWIGFNPYVECDSSHTDYTQSTGLQALMQDYRDTEYARIIMLGEFGCNLGDNTIDGYEAQREFYDARWMNEEEDMTSEVVGGNVFEFSTELVHLISGELTKKKDAGRYGVGYFQPDDCDNVKIMCEYTPYPEFNNLQKHYTETKNSTLSITKYEASDKILTCPKTMSIDLPPTPDVELLACSVLQPVCNGVKSNNFDHDGTQALAMGVIKAPSNVGTEEGSVAGNAPSTSSSSGSKSSGSSSLDKSAAVNAETWMAHTAAICLAMILAALM